jgi:phosphatidylserine/phosphatidylglycerophosphate/cardiolipin synthase-like enzyme
MKSRKKLSLAYKIIISLAILISVIFVIKLILGAAFYASRNHEINTPALSISTSTSLSVNLDFNNEVEVKGAIEKFEQSINKAKHSIEVAVFSLNSDRIRKALVNADKRGVKVTMILDSSRLEQHDSQFKNSAESIIRINRGKYDSENSRNTWYMHHKFMIVDRGYLNAELTTGSLNFTDIGEKYNESFFLTTSDISLISIYGREFDLMKNGLTGVNKLTSREYDPWSAKVQYGNGYVEVWMSPGFATRSAKYRILQLIESATSSIDIMMWYFTDDDIARALIRKSEGGVNVRVITEDTNATSTTSVIPFMLAEKSLKKLSTLEIVLDTKSTTLIKQKVPEGFNPYFHQHTMVVDRGTAVFGTNNWSIWGFYHNDEDTLITDNAYIVSQFEKTFDYFYKQLK